MFFSSAQLILIGKFRLNNTDKQTDLSYSTLLLSNALIIFRDEELKLIVYLAK